MPSFTTLRVWQVAHNLALEVTRAVRSFPSYERFELSSQLRRASVSVAANLVEGNARFGKRELLRHARISAGSLAEVGYLLLFARDAGYLESAEFERLDDVRRHCTVLLNRFA